MIVCEHSLSKMWIFGFNPLEVSILCILAYTVVNYEAFLGFIGSAMILLESVSKSTIIYFLPLLDVTGNWPIWSV